MPQPSTERYRVCALNLDDTVLYRTLFMKMALEEGHLFGTAPDRMAKRRQIAWDERCAKQDDRCVFGLFDHQHLDHPRLIGMLAVFKVDEKNAFWWGAYLRPEYRRQGLMSLLYKARERWTTDRGFKAAAFIVVDGNKRCADIHERHGAICIRKDVWDWPGFSPTLTRLYERRFEY